MIIDCCKQIANWFGFGTKRSANQGDPQSKNGEFSIKVWRVGDELVLEKVKLQSKSKEFKVIFGNTNILPTADQT